MFDRVEYKRIAKKQLKGRWATPILATLVMLAVILIISIPEIIAIIANSEGSEDELRYVTTGNFTSLITIGIAGILGIAYTKLFIDLWKTRDPLPFSAFISAFSLWFKGALAMLWYYLWVFLWSLLFFIPGIVKAYAYSQIFFIIAENPKIGVRKAMKISIEITRGYKGDLFIMDLSFIGWEILTGLTGGLLYLYVMPYMQMSKTNAYKMLKAMALQSGRLRPEDFGEQPQYEQPTDFNEQPATYNGQQADFDGQQSNFTGQPADFTAPVTPDVISLPPNNENDAN
ncbi:MAG: DUF975 family protein [Treponema sp.]|nr:DUF975 family protein [Treponema sp.]